MTMAGYTGSLRAEFIHLDGEERTFLHAHKAAPAQCLIDVGQLVWFELNERFQPTCLPGDALATRPAILRIDAR
jgi:hypothetical protein